MKRKVNIFSKYSSKMDEELDKDHDKVLNWMNLSPLILESLSDGEKTGILKELLKGGQREHELFYQGLLRSLGDEAATAVIKNIKSYLSERKKRDVASTRYK